MKATLQQVADILDDRPKKLDAEQVGYEAAPEGSEFRCASCLRYYRRAVDNFATCEIFRDEETDENGVNPAYRCRFWTSDGDQHPLLEN